MKFVTGNLNGERLQNILYSLLPEADEVLAAVAYAHATYQPLLFDECWKSKKKLTFYGRYDETVPISLSILATFLDRRSPNFACHLVADIFHPKVIWFRGAGAYIGSANLTDAAWNSNIEAGVLLLQADLEADNMEGQLSAFFDQVHQRSTPLSNEILAELKRWESEREKKLGQAESALSASFKAKRLIPEQPGIGVIVNAADNERRRDRFITEWRQTLQIMRDIGAVISSAENRPDWIRDDVPLGVQADQFLHAYYYQRVVGDRSNHHPYEEFHALNSSNSEAALRDAIAWWRGGQYSHVDEERTIYDWAEKIRRLSGPQSLQTINSEDFVDLMSCVHAFREHASRVPHAELGLPSEPQEKEVMIEALARRLYSARSANGKTVPQLIYQLLYSGTEERLAERLWEAHQSDDLKIPRLGPSTLGELVGWALPDRFPPRNGRTSKALRALGYNVSVYF